MKGLVIAHAHTTVADDDCDAETDGARGRQTSTIQTNWHLPDTRASMPEHFERKDWRPRTRTRTTVADDDDCCSRHTDLGHQTTSRNVPDGLSPSGEERRHSDACALSCRRDDTLLALADDTSCSSRQTAEPKRRAPTHGRSVATATIVTLADC